MNAILFCVHWIHPFDEAILRKCVTSKMAKWQKGMTVVLFTHTDDVLECYFWTIVSAIKILSHFPRVVVEFSLEFCIYLFFNIFFFCWWFQPMKIINNKNEMAKTDVENEYANDPIWIKKIYNKCHKRAFWGSI